MRKLLIILSMIMANVFCFSLLDLGVPIESIIHEQNRESFLISGIGKLSELLVQLNIAYGKVKFGIDIYNRTQNYMTMDLNSYKWKSGICSKENKQIEDYQIRIELPNVYSTKTISNKLKKLLMSQKFIVTVEAQQNSKYKLVTATDRIYLKPNSSVEFLLRKKNDTISYVVETNNFFLLNTQIKTGEVKAGEVKMTINRLIQQELSDTSTAVSHQQSPISQLLKDSELLFDQIVQDRESLQIGNKKKTVFQYIVTLQNTQDKSVNVAMNWSNLQGQQIIQANNSSDTFYGKLYNFFIGYNIPQGKQIVKISIMICIAISFLLYAISFVLRNMSTRKQKSHDEWFEDDRI